MVDFEKLKSIYKLGRNFTLADIQIIFQSAYAKSYSAKEYLIKEGGLKKDVFFIRKGLIRAFKVNHKGEEITTLIRYENQIVGSIDIILFNQPSQFYFETLEPTDVYRIDHDVLQEIISQNPKLEANRKFIFQNILKDASQRIHSFVLLSPEERYIQYVKANPDIINRVPGKYIANILGITPVSLSRIRRRIASKKK